MQFAIARIAVGLGWLVFALAAQRAAAQQTSADIDQPVAEDSGAEPFDPFAELTPVPAAPSGAASGPTEPGRISFRTEPADDAPAETPTPAAAVDESAAETAAADVEHDAPPAAAPPERGVDPLELPPETPLDLEPAELQGVKPGVSTLDDVKTAWGEPQKARTRDNIDHLTYVFEPFKQVDVALYKGLVRSVVIELDRGFPADDIARQLELDEFQRVTIHDEFGEPHGEAFPERGVTFNYLPRRVRAEDRLVSRLTLEPIEAKPFVIRAESRMRDDYTATLVDLRTAKRLDPEGSRHFWLEARLLSDLGRQDAALESVATALEHEPKNPEYRATRAKILINVGQYDQAIEEAKLAIGMSSARPEIRAIALTILGDALSAGPQRDHKQAMELHLQAIRTADPLTHDRRPAVRRAAHEALVDAHLAAGRCVAWGFWKAKPQVVPRWIEQAATWADNGIKQGDLDAACRLRVAKEALAASVGMEGDLDPTPWTERAKQEGENLLANCTDPLRQRHIEWELGAAMYDALQVYHMTGKTDAALDIGDQAVAHLEHGAEGRDLEPAEAYLLGRLYFRMGSVHAIHSQDHAAAVAWFEKATPLLERPIPPAAFADLGRQGESMVSMAVSYWETANRDEAVRLTQRGAELMQQAVQQGILAESALAVPHSNLATMFQFVGDTAQAESYRELAARNSETKTE